MASLASLPPEILSLIIRPAIETGPDAAAVCAAVSRQWQQHVERKTFASLRLDTYRASEARSIVTPARQSLVRHICMEIVLPEYDEPKLRGLRETDEEMRQNNQAFTRAILALFDYLRHWEPVAPGTGQPGVTLQLCAFSPSDKLDGVATTTTLRARRWKHSFLSLQSGVGDDLPAVGIITIFGELPYHLATKHPHHHQYLLRRIAPGAFGVMASRMTNLDEVFWPLEDNEKEDVQLRQKLRREFAASLANLPKALRHFRIWYPHLGPMNHDMQPHRAQEDGVSSDHLSIALRRVAQQCTSFILDCAVVFDANLFWPQLSSLQETPHWPHLEVLMVMSSMVSPSGAWRFHADPSIPRGPPPAPRYLPNSPEVLTGDDPQYSYRVLLDDEYYGELSLAAARAAARMPRLKKLWVVFHAPGKCNFGYRVKGGGTSAEYWSESTPALPLTAEAEEAWRAVAKVHVGEGGMMSFGLVDLGEGRPSSSR